MRNRIRKLDQWQKCFLLFAIVVLALLGGYIFYCTFYFFHSDMATRLLLASEQIRTHQLFPDGWHNTTGIFVGIWELLLIPFMLVLPNWILCREFVVIIEVALTLIAIIALFRSMDTKNWLLPSCICIVFMCLPLGQYDTTFYDASYLPLVLYFLVVFIAIIHLMDEKYSAKGKYYALLAITVFLACYGSMRNYVIIILPAFLVILLFYWLTYGENCIFEWKKDNGIWTVATLIFACILALIVMLYLQSKYPVATVGGHEFTNQVTDNIKQFISSLLEFYQASSTCAIFSLSGVRICSNFVFLVMSVFVAPVYFIIKYKDIENKIIKMFIIYAWISNFVVVFMMIFSTATYARFYVTVYFNNIIFLSLFVKSIWPEKRKDIKGLLFVLILSLAVINHLYYFRGTVSNTEMYWKEAEQGETLVDFLRENNLKYGVSTYWNAYANMCRANGEIVIVSCMRNESTKEITPKVKFLWGTSDYFYMPENYPGRSFLLLEEGESVADGYYKLASEVKKFKQYTILIFEQNIYSYDLENIQ